MIFTPVRVHFEPQFGRLIPRGVEHCKILSLNQSHSYSVKGVRFLSKFSDNGKFLASIIVINGII